MLTLGEDICKKEQKTNKKWTKSGQKVNKRGQKANKKRTKSEQKADKKTNKKRSFFSNIFLWIQFVSIAEIFKPSLNGQP